MKKPTVIIDENEPVDTEQLLEDFRHGQGIFAGESSGDV
jgi:hypothetical protein